jgi:hypothetical protein
MKKISVLLLIILAVGCGYTKPSNSMGSGAAPVITNLMPNSTMMPGQAFTLTVNGSNFTSGSVIYWGMTPKATTFMTAGQLTASITSTDTACSMTPCTVQVYVRTSGGVYGGGVNSNMMSFTIN